MLVSYNYLKKNGEEFGWFQCDFEDFKKFFWNRFNSDIECLILKKDGKMFIWSESLMKYGCYGMKKGRLGFCYVGKH